MQDNSYLIQSLFQENENISEENVSIPLDEINNESNLIFICLSLIL